MRKFFTATIATLVMAAPATAADMPVKARPLSPPPVFTWTGCYVGLNGGGAWQNRHNALSLADGPNGGVFASPNYPAMAAAGSGDLDTQGFIGGVQVGCNYQTGSVVWGAESDFNWMQQDASIGGQFAFTVVPTFSYNLTVLEEKKWLWTLRGRVGWTFDRAMVYFTGGVAVVRYNFEQNFFDPQLAGAPAGRFIPAAISENRAGWTVGAGGEFALWDCCLSLKAEYLFARLKSETAVGQYSVRTFPNTTSFTNVLSEADLHILRVGLNYRFGPNP